MNYHDSIVARSQKKGGSSYSSSTFGQVNCVDLGYYSYTGYALFGGTDDLCSWNIFKRSKGITITSSSSSIGAATAVRISPKQDFVAYATGTDWCKGMHELDHLKKPRIAVTPISQSDLKTLTSK